jgi:hypothetical protein
VLATSIDDDTSDAQDGKEKEEKKKGDAANSGELKKLVNVLRPIINELSDEDGWANLGAVGNVLNRRLPDFDTRNYGYIKLSALKNSLKQFEGQFRKQDNAHQTLAYVRNKTLRRRRPKAAE